MTGTHGCYSIILPVRNMVCDDTMREAVEAMLRKCMPPHDIDDESLRAETPMRKKVRRMARML
jgi:hypothetical protein